ncbi:hypothetical protein HRbin30_02415 [bacterium HR30]|nr:hypothetical protein HRbin30_02415 [bacterium HR30]
MSDRVYLHVKDGATPAGYGAAKGGLEFARMGNAFSVTSHGLSHLTPVCIHKVGFDCPRSIGSQCVLELLAKGLKGDHLVNFHHPPLAVAAHKVERAKPVSHGGFDFLNVVAHRPVANDAIHWPIGGSDGGTEGLADSGA